VTRRPNIRQRSGKRNREAAPGGLAINGTYCPTEALPEWLATKFAARMTLWQSGRFDSCVHNPTFSSGIPVRMVAWNPRLITCPGCAHLGMLPPSDPENFRCDGCGVTVASADDLSMGEVTLDRVRFAYGVCATCRASMP
jgi:hypothetical protein